MPRILDNIEQRLRPALAETMRVAHRADFCGFTDEERDFIINYDIKYRMGRGMLGMNDGDREA